MMNINRILVANNGMEIRITEMNNRQVVRDRIYRMAECVSLIDNDYTIDYKTIAGLLCMTEEEFKRNYKLGRTESEREDRVCGADWILTYAEFTKKDEFDILLEAIQNGDIKITNDEDEVTEEMMNNAIEHIYYMDRVLGENCEILESDWRNENYTTYVTEDEKYRYTLTESDIARVAIAMKYSDKENVYETICPIVEEILIEQFAKMRKEDMAKKVISLSEYRNRR